MALDFLKITSVIWSVTCLFLVVHVVSILTINLIVRFLVHVISDMIHRYIFVLSFL